MRAGTMDQRRAVSCREMWAKKRISERENSIYVMVLDLVEGRRKET